MHSPPLDLETPSPQEMIAAYRRLADDLEAFGRVGLQAVESPATISEWVIAKRAVPILLGTVTGHPRISSGKAAATTEIVFWDEQQRLARTINRWYRLGRPLIGGSSQ